MSTEKQPRPTRKGSPPSVTAVIKFLKSAGFQHARYAESLARGGAAGASVRRHSNNSVYVRWNEGDRSLSLRMAEGGHESAATVPQHPDTVRRTNDYAEALAPRYTVSIHSGTYVYLTARESLPERPKGVPTAATVRKALASADVATSREFTTVVRVVDQPDHTRISVAEESDLAAVRAALEAEGWTFEEFETIEHYGIKITGSMPDRPARLRKLRAQRAAQEQSRATQAEFLQRAQAAEAPQEEPSPVGSYVAWAEGPQERTERGYVIGHRDDEALVLGDDGGFRQMPANVPETETETEQRAPATAHYAQGRRFFVGQRITQKTADGLLYSGTITGFETLDGSVLVIFDADSRQVAPNPRPIKGVPLRPEKVRPISPPQSRRTVLDKRVNPA